MKGLTKASSSIIRDREEKRIKTVLDNGTFKGENNPMHGVSRYGEDNPNFDNHWEKDKVYITKICPNCKSEFKVQDNVHGNNREFCSTKCKAQKQGWPKNAAEISASKRRGKSGVEIYGEQKAKEISDKISIANTNPTQEKRDNLSKAMDKRMEDGYKPFKAHHFNDYANHSSGSYWEDTLAELLVDCGIKYVYNKRFIIIDSNNKKHNFYPDFLLKEHNIILDPKGPIKSQYDIDKWEMFKQQYPQYKVVLIGNLDNLQDKFTIGLNCDFILDIENLEDEFIKFFNL